MNRAIYLLLGAQFLTAFADNAILFTIFAMVTQNGDQGEWYKPALQAAFLAAFVLLAPWVGRFADQHAKGRVLTWGNTLKAGGTLLLIGGVDPLFAYAVVGVGAAVYGPAKYGILPDIVSHDRLVKANGWIEGSTVIAILLGAVIGAHVSDHSIGWALALVAGAYGVSLVTTLLLPKTAVAARDSRPVLGQFVVMLRGFLVGSRARFSMLGAAIFWATAVVLRVMLVAWAPVVLFTTSTSEIADLTAFIALGIAAGSIVVPWLIPIEQLRRARLAAYVMGALIIALGFVDHTYAARAVLFAIGMAGGVFVVPINAALQEIGHRTIGAGGAVAIQNFFENLAMLLGTGLYTLALSQNIAPVASIFTLGTLVIIATTLVAWRLPKNPGQIPVSANIREN